MSLKSKIYIAIIAFSLAVIVAVLAARRIESVWLKPAASEESEEEAQSEDNFYYPFINEAAKAAQSDEEVPLPDRMVIALEEDEAYVPEKQMQKPFFGGQIDLPALAKEQEAYINSQGGAAADIGQEKFKNNERLELSFNNYENDPELQRFVRDMRRAMGEDLSNTQLSPQEMMDKILNNPQMRKILLEYSKNPKIMQMVENIIRNDTIPVRNNQSGPDKSVDNN